MKKITIALCILISTVLFSSLSSCKKVWDYVKHHPDGVADNCNIKSISFSYVYDDGYLPPFTVKDTANFTYDASGNPLSIKFAVSKNENIGLSAFTNDKLFKYNNKKQLVVYLEEVARPQNIVGNNYSCVYWHKYTYVTDRLIKDSIFSYGNGNYLVNDRPEGNVSADRVIEFTLDEWGRAIKMKEGLNEMLYNYDASGNLVKAGVTYTNKTNIKQTSKTWMFLARDYSVNAPSGEATSYNSNNLPTLFNNGIPFFIEHYSFLSNQTQKVNYTCK